QADAAAAAVADVEDAPELRLGFRLVAGLGIFPVERMPGRSLERTFSHELSVAGATAVLVRQAVERLLELVGVATLGLGERLEPVGNLAEAFVARLLRHARVHVGVLVRLAGD